MLVVSGEDWARTVADILPDRRLTILSGIAPIR